MKLSPKILRFVWILVAAGLLLAAGGVLKPLNKTAQENELASNFVANEENPEMALLTVAPGGLRSLLVNYFWIRSQKLHQDGRHYDAVQLADIICTLQPRFPSVWGFQAWQMAWNISVETHTPRERWQWVSRGIQLLRDKGIRMNPNALMLYKDLAWIYSSKMGDTTDDMHKTYKARWAWEMQRLLGAPPFATTAETLKAFEPITEAPIDKTFRRQGRQLIQTDQLVLLEKQNPDVAEYLKELAKFDVKPDWSFLEKYNEYTKDESVSFTRLNSKRVTDKREIQIAKLINNDDFKVARDKLLAFLRAQILWNTYKMDPQFMYQLMQEVGPIDWRLVWAHGLYWSAYGTKVTLDSGNANINWINTDRTRLNCLKNLTWNGRMTYVENPQTPKYPTIKLSSDWRFVDSTHKEFIRLGTLAAESKGREFEKNSFKSGHENYLKNSISMLFTGGRYKQAQEYIDWIRKEYKPRGEQWAIEDVEDFVAFQLMKEGTPIPRIARSQLTASLQMAFIFLTDGDMAKYKKNLNYAVRVYNAYHTGARTTDRLRMPPMNDIAWTILAELLVRPRLSGYNLTIDDRSMLYKRVITNWPAVAVRVYDPTAKYLKIYCKSQRLDFNKMFPQPPGLEQYRQSKQQQMAPLGAN